VAAHTGKEKFRRLPTPHLRQDPRVRILAHRGAHGGPVRENSLEAFRAALEVHADGVELDVRLSADGDLLVHHDAALADGRPIAELTPATTPPWLPTLAQALATLGDALVNVEIKASPLEPAYDPSHAVAAAVADALPAHANVLVSSFNLHALDLFHERSPGIPTGWLTTSGYDQIAAVDTARAKGHRAINPPGNVTDAAVVAAAHAAGLEVVVWTVNEPDQMREMAAIGVDILVTDRPADAVKLRAGA
jgi:glycerophosphoryl diester phosphodiesterase